MDNVRKLQRQALKQTVVCLIIMDVSVGLLVFGAWGDVLPRMMRDDITSLILLMAIISNFAIVRHMLTLHPSVKNLPPEIREAINEQCMTGMICGNGILCEDDYLLVVDRELKVVGPEELAWIEVRKMPFGKKALWVMTRRQTWHVIMSSGYRLRGNGTFRPVDIDTFRRELERIIFGDSVRSDAAGKIQKNC